MKLPSLVPTESCVTRKITMIGKLLLLIAFAYFLFPQPTFAHAFGRLYNLPVPFWLYLYAGAAAVIASFVVIGYFIQRSTRSTSYPTLALSASPLVSLLGKTWLLGALKAGSVLLLVFSILTGLFGIDNSYSNFNMTFFWIIVVLGLTYFTAVFGNLYSLINPWKVILDAVQKVLGWDDKGLLSYPKRLNYYPALVLYFLLIWVELLGGSSPYKLSVVLLQYTSMTLLGAFVFGKETWLRYGELFSVFFRLIGHLAVFEIKNGKLFLRPPFIALLKLRVEHFSLLLFILFMLSSTAFDGFRETTVWSRFYWGSLDSQVRPVLGTGAYPTVQTLGLLLSPLVFLAIYLILIFIAKIVTETKKGIGELALRFAPALLPVALAYNFAHYYTLLLTQGQELIRLISDPFGFGWNLFSTANFRPNLAIVDANFTWHSQVVVILVGHIAGVYLSHLLALEVFPTHKRALLSQLPMLVLMVIYTILGLWILSQPITGSG